MAQLARPGYQKLAQLYASYVKKLDPSKLYGSVQTRIEIMKKHLSKDTVTAEDMEAAEKEVETVLKAQQDREMPNSLVYKEMKKGNKEATALYQLYLTGKTDSKLPGIQDAIAQYRAEGEVIDYIKGLVKGLPAAEDYAKIDALEKQSLGLVPKEYFDRLRTKLDQQPYVVMHALMAVDVGTEGFEKQHEVEVAYAMEQINKMNAAKKRQFDNFEIIRKMQQNPEDVTVLDMLKFLPPEIEQRLSHDIHVEYYGDMGEINTPDLTGPKLNNPDFLAMFEAVGKREDLIETMGIDPKEYFEDHPELYQEYLESKAKRDAQFKLQDAEKAESERYESLSFEEGIVEEYQNLSETYEVANVRPKLDEEANQIYEESRK